jgi:hypothetical protein
VRPLWQARHAPGTLRCVFVILFTSSSPTPFAVCVDNQSAHRGEAQFGQLKLNLLRDTHKDMVLKYNQLPSVPSNDSQSMSKDEPFFVFETPKPEIRTLERKLGQRKMSFHTPVQILLFPRGPVPNSTTRLPAVGEVSLGAPPQMPFTGASLFSYGVVPISTPKLPPVGVFPRGVPKSLTAQQGIPRSTPPATTSTAKPPRPKKRDISEDLTAIANPPEKKKRETLEMTIAKPMSK